MKNPTLAFKPTAIDDAPRRQPEPPASDVAQWQLLRQWTQSQLARWAQPEAAFWRLGLLFGLLFLVITPPFQAPDEWHHFNRAYYLAEAGVFAVRLNDPAVGTALPRSVGDTIIDVTGKVIGNPQEKQSGDKVFANLARPLNPHDRVFADFRAVAFYAPVSYMPQAIGIRLGMFFEQSPLALAYLGRLTNLLVALLLTWLAIRLLPLMKWGLLLLAMTPMAVFQRSSLSADVLLNALAFLFIALVVRAAWPRAGRLTRGEVVALGGVALLLGLCKPPYFALALLCLLIPRARFGGTKQYLATMAGILIVGAIAILAWATAVRGLMVPVIGAPIMRGQPPDADLRQLMGEQARFLAQQPLQLAAIFWHSIKFFWHPYYASFIGVLGWLDTQLPRGLINSYAVTLLLVALLDGDRHGALNWRARLWMLAVLALGLIGIGVSVYLQWSPIGSGHIEGLQGRYFIPLSPLLFLPLTLRRRAVDLARWRLHWLLLGYLIWVMVVTLHTMFLRYYLPAPL